MVYAGEINAKLDNYMLQRDEHLKRIEDSITTLIANAQASITALTVKVVLTERVDKGQEDALKNFEERIPDLNHLRLQQHDPNPRVNHHGSDPRMNAVDRGSKLDVGDFNGDNGPEIFFDWIHSLDGELLSLV